ncbi:hypothetical protein [Marinitoga lauensis]|uniref:hypothetical protein n=1 Tax=Marinitoga lauensis TaxID=2201189 RepID=UPI0010130E16|nr:hypothetical protein [Marinitoga lauensis]
MISPVSGVSYQYTPQISKQAHVQAARTVQQTSQDFENLLNAIVYKQDGLTRKLVRIVGEMYQGQKLDILA